MNAFRSTDIAAHTHMAGFAAQTHPWHPPGVTPGAEHNSGQWVTAWSELVARKEA